MVSAIQKWATVGSSYFNKNLDIVDTTKKTDLATVFKATLARLDTLSYFDADTTANAALNIKNRFLKAYSSMNLAKRIYLRVLGFFGFSLYGTYSRLLGRLTRITAESYSGSLKGLVEKKLQSQDEERRDFFDNAIVLAKKKIDARKSSTGFIYKVINAQGVTSYLVGSVPFESKKTQLDKRFNEIFLFSKKFIPVVRPKDLHEKVSRDYSKWCHPTGRRLDALAKKKHVLVVPLEEIGNLSTQISPGLQEAAASLLSPHERIRASTHQKFLPYECIEAWQIGNEEEFISCTRAMQPSSVFNDQRTRKWLYGTKGHGLIQKIQETTVPICVCAPAICCVGDDGIAKALRDNHVLVSRFWEDLGSELL